MRYIIFFLCFGYSSLLFGQTVLPNICHLKMEVTVPPIKYDNNPKGLLKFFGGKKPIEDRSKADLIIEAEINDNKGHSQGSNKNSGSLALWDVCLDTEEKLRVLLEDYDKDILNINKNDHIACFLIDGKKLLNKEKHTFYENGSQLIITVTPKIYSAKVRISSFTANNSQSKNSRKLSWTFRGKGVKSKKINTEGKIFWRKACNVHGKKGAKLAFIISVEGEKPQTINFKFDTHLQKIETDYGIFELDLSIK